MFFTLDLSSGVARKKFWGWPRDKFGEIYLNAEREAGGVNECMQCTNRKACSPQEIRLGLSCSIESSGAPAPRDFMQTDVKTSIEISTKLRTIFIVLIGFEVSFHLLSHHHRHSTYFKNTMLLNHNRHGA